MFRTRLLFLLALPVLALAGVASAGDDRSLTSEATAGTAAFHDLAQAEAAGYGEFRDAAGIACIDLPGSGGMGVHYVNGALVGDAVLDPARPEALVYDARRNGTPKLVAVEYIVFKDVWEQSHTGTPSLFGRELELVPSPNRYGIPAFYALHAWLWKPNPSGLLATWNPQVDC
jgi:hypothetical protein